MGCFKQWLCDLRVREVTPCHGDYMVSSLWRRFLSYDRYKKDKISHYLVSAPSTRMHMPKRAIPPTMNMAWTFIMIHASLLWTDTERVLTTHLSLSLVLCSETFGMDTLTCCSNKCLVEHHSLGIFNQAVLWLYGSPPLWCVGMSRVCPWSTLWPVTSQVESQV